MSFGTKRQCCYGFILAKSGRFWFGFELKTAISVSVRFSDPERASSATRAAHDPTPHVSARLNSALFNTAPNVSAPPGAAALRRSVRQFSNYASAQVIFKGAPNPAEQEYRVGLWIKHPASQLTSYMACHFQLCITSVPATNTASLSDTNTDTNQLVADGPHTRGARPPPAISALIPTITPAGETSGRDVLQAVNVQNTRAAPFQNRTVNTKA